MTTNPSWTFESDLIQARVESDGIALRSHYIEKATGVRIGELLLPYRLLSRDGWHGEAREMQHRFTPGQNGYEVDWAATIAHPVNLHMAVQASGEGTFDVTVRAEILGSLPDYELFQSWYFDPGYEAGSYVTPLPYETPSAPGVLQVCPRDGDLYREMYVSFPRDERAAELLCDGRWQRGRHFTRFLPCRYYALPLGFYANRSNGLGIVMMGRREDTFAVNMAYHSDDPQNSVGCHNSFYLSLLGRDVKAGETVTTRFRMVIGRFGADAGRHLAEWNAWSSAA